MNCQNYLKKALQKHLQLLSLLLLSPYISFAQTHSNSQNHPFTADTLKTSYTTSNQIPLTDSIINYGKIFLNTRYRRGSSGVSGFDCSGFTSFVYRNFGYNLSHSSSVQADQFGQVDRCQLKTGDLVFFSGRRKSKRIGHVGIVVSADQDGKFNFIHSSTQNGVIISSSEEPYYTARYIKATRVIADNPLLAITTPITMPENNKTETVGQTSVFPAVNPVNEITKVIPAQFHRVKKGETLSTIAQKFGLTLSDLKRKNNITGNRINPKQHLKIKDAETILVEESQIPIDKNPLKTLEEPKKTETLTIEQALANNHKSEHIVQRGETLFSISNLYNLTIDELKKLNNILSGKIKIGQKLKLNNLAQVPGKPEIAQTESPNPESTPQIQPAPPPSNHKVASGETLFGIAKSSNLAVAYLKKINHLNKNKIKIGQTLKLSEISENQNRTTEKEISPQKTQNSPKVIHHKVKPGETFYSIAKTYNCKVEQLKEWNKKSKHKLKAGEKILIFAQAD